jgi:hypothetical protein
VVSPGAGPEFQSPHADHDREKKAKIFRSTPNFCWSGRDLSVIEKFSIGFDASNQPDLPSTLEPKMTFTTTAPPGQGIPKTLLLALLMAPALTGISQCGDTDADGDDWTIGQGDCDDENADVHPQATEVCDGIDNDCDRSIDEDFNYSCLSEELLSGPPADAPGGMRILDDSGALYYTTYTGGLYVVPPGGGVATQLVTREQTGAYGFLGNASVTDDGLVLFDGGEKGLLAYDPASGGLSVYSQATARSGSYGWSHFLDASGLIGVGSSQTLLLTDGTTELVEFFAPYILVTSQFVYAMYSSFGEIERYGLEGQDAITWATDMSDNYGLALGADGALFVGQGNHNPSIIYRIAPEGGAASAFSTVPIAVTAVISSADGRIFVSGYPGNDLYEIDPITGESAVYGCDPAACDWQ